MKNGNTGLPALTPLVNCNLWFSPSKNQNLCTLLGCYWIPSQVRMVPLAWKATSAAQIADAETI